ncbi:MAG: tetratricopeptide repeat protein [Desulfamplus sp.]|nr:tetratricopeptide repeat protein [Desulfamplus sp.]
MKREITSLFRLNILHWGKVYFKLEDYPKAKDALIFSMNSGNPKKPDHFVVELLARVLLALGESQKALDTLRVIPENIRFPYFRWTESDVLCSLNRFKEAAQTLEAALERDNLSKHKTFIRLAKLYYLQRNFEQAERAAAGSVQFFRKQWCKSYNEGLFWQALSAFRMGNVKKAEGIAAELKRYYPHYPKLGTLLATIRME